MSDMDAVEEPEVISSMVDRVRCSNSAATAMVVVQGGAAWSRCVRLKDHEGDCIRALSEAQEVHLTVLTTETKIASNHLRELKNALQKILEKKEKADAAWLT